jgi:hypothetical protein
MSAGFATGKELYRASRVRPKALYAVRANEKFHLFPACCCTGITPAGIKIMEGAAK